jgi:S1-C subfamily serine protease
MTTHPQRPFRTSAALLLAPALILLLTGCSRLSSRGQAAATPTPFVTAGAPAATATAPAPAATATGQGTARAAPTPAGSTPAPSSRPAGAETLTTAIREVAQRVRPAVVQITSEQVQADQFNQPFSVPAGVGSGVIYDSQGHILTNNHVIAGAQRLLVSLPDGRSFPGKVVGGDSQTDLAVLQIGGDNLPRADFGDPGQLQVGDWVVAIGNALALEGGPTVTEGVVSALGRTVQEPGGPSGGPGGLGAASAGPFLFDVIQTSAPINPGNSGGPLLSLDGKVVGINTLVAGQAEPGVQAQGIGFAISVAVARPVADQLVANGRVTHAFLGIRYTPLNPAIAAQLGLNVQQGALIGAVVSGSPAAQAGVRARDVITEIDGQALKGESALAQAVDHHKPGDKISLSINRGGQQSRVDVTLGQQPSS